MAEQEPTPEKKGNAKLSTLLLSTNETILNHEESSSMLITLYMLANQAMYAICAAPVGIAYSISPAFLNEQKGISVEVIGYMLSAGEALGVVGLKLGEYMEKGFIFRRPYDLYFVAACLGTFVILIPIWPSSVWYLSGASMMMVLAFNSMSLPIIAESIHRLSLMAEKEPNIIFAQANMVKRFSNAMIGLLAPLIYSAVPVLPFYFFGGFCLSFLIVYGAVNAKITSIHKECKKTHGPDTSLVRSLSMRSNELHSARSHRNMTRPPRRQSKQLDKGYSIIARLKSFKNHQDRKSTENDDDDKNGSSGNIFWKSAMHLFGHSSRDVDANGSSLRSTNTNPSLRSTNTNPSLRSTNTNPSLRSKVTTVEPMIIEEGDEDEESNSTTSDKDEESPATVDEKEIQVKEHPPATKINDRTIKSVETTAREDSFHDSDEAEETPGDLEEAAGPRVSFGKVVVAGDSESMELPEAVTATTEPKTRRPRVSFEDSTEPAVPKKKKLTWDDFLDRYAYFLVVYVFAFFDTANSVFPFPFLSIAIENKKIAAFVIFAYQLGRAVSQSVQVWRCDPVVNYVLNGIPLLSYIGFVIYTSVSEGDLWYILLIFSSVSETCPIQQLYLLRLFDDPEGADEMALRAGVKSSYTSMGYAGIFSFFAVSQVYGRLGIRATAYLGLGMVALKVLAIVQIDLIHARKAKKAKALLAAEEEAAAKITAASGRSTTGRSSKSMRRFDSMRDLQKTYANHESCLNVFRN